MKIVNLNKFNIYGVILALLLAVPTLYANDFGISEQQLTEIENRVNQMNVSQLNARRVELLAEQASLQANLQEGS